MFRSTVGVVLARVERGAVFSPHEKPVLAHDDAVDLTLGGIEVPDLLAFEAVTRTAFEVEVFSTAFVEPLSEEQESQKQKGETGWMERERRVEVEDWSRGCEGKERKRDEKRGRTWKKLSLVFSWFHRVW